MAARGANSKAFSSTHLFEISSLTLLLLLCTHTHTAHNMLMGVRMDLYILLPRSPGRRRVHARIAID
jgi:hypothetical protein